MTYRGPAGVIFTAKELALIRRWASIFPETPTIREIRDKLKNLETSEPGSTRQQTTD